MHPEKAKARPGQPAPSGDWTNQKGARCVSIPIFTYGNRCNISAHKDLSGSKVRMGQAHRARVWPEPAGSRVRKDIRSGWTVAQR